jgi:tRNA isopentenyl-2-thiomethyl-A-37 hydroxylase MiaE
LGLSERAAARAGRGARVDLEPRIAAFATLEAQLITSPDALFRFHSGPPEP